ncbi:hypothetical protein C8R47DRAFT_928416, partial [Mycena vitilis]
KVHSVRKLANGNILVMAHNEEQAKLLVLHGNDWITSFEPNAELHRKKYYVKADYVPINFDPKAAGAASAIYYENAGTLSSPSSVLETRWLHEQKDASKSASSLVIVLDDEKAADALIHRSLALMGTSCPVSKFEPGPPMCFHCQGHGHMAKACPKGKDPTAVKCARCAGSHATRDCH